MSKTPMTDDVIAKLLAAPLSDEARKIIYEQALAFDDVPNLPKSDTVYTPEELKKRAEMKCWMDRVALSAGKPVDWDALEKAIEGEFPKGGLPPG